MRLGASSWASSVTDAASSTRSAVIVVDAITISSNSSNSSNSSVTGSTPSSCSSPSVASSVMSSGGVKVAR